MSSWLTIAAAFLLITCSSFDIAEAVCTNTSVAWCYESIRGLYLSSPVYESDVATYCSNINQLCSSTLTECGCTERYSQEHIKCMWFIGYKSGLAYACSTDYTRSVFLRNRQCIVTNDAKKQEVCIRGQTCLEYDDSLQCYYYAMLSSCNKETASLMTQVQLRVFQPSANNVGCTLHLPSEVSGAGPVASRGLCEVLIVAVLASVTAAAPKFLQQLV